jgi:hypothetical protein
MTNDTKAALQQATEALSAARADADREISACLTQIAKDLPARAAEAAKRVAIQQPEVTKGLGKEGVAELRSELEAAAENLGREFVAAADKIDWPRGTSYSKVENRMIHSALFERFYRRTGALTRVLGERGYDVQGSDPFLPQYLYTESKFTPLSAALTALGTASANFEKAKKADDDAAVHDLWGE